MIARPISVGRLCMYQFASVGIYFYIWAYRLGQELTLALKRPAVPRLWWFLLPGGAYYWVWRLAESLDDATGGRVSRTDVILWYILLTALAYSGPSSFVQLYEVVSSTWISVGFVTMILFAVAAHALFMCAVQAKLTKLRAG